MIVCTFCALDTKRSRGLRSAECASLTTKILPVADPGRGARGARYPLKKKKKKKKKKGKKKHEDPVHDELKRDPYEDTDVEVDGRFKRAN